jgi:hypothetical protein
MKKTLTVGLAGLLAASLLSPASAGAPAQEEDGVIAAPAPFTDDSGCFAGLQRRVAIVSQEQAKGIVGYNFDIDKATWGGKFALEVTDGVGDVDMDILFYGEFGTVDDVVNDPGGAGAPFSVGFQTREPGGEAGVVPKEVTKAIVCIYAGQQGAGAAGAFHYEASAPVKKKKK